MGEGGQKAQASRQNINNSWRYNIRLDDYSKYNTDYFQVAKRVVSLERSRHRKKKLCTVTNVNKKYCGDHFIIHKYQINMLFTPETNIMLYVNCTLIIIRDINRTFNHIS